MPIPDHARRRAAIAALILILLTASSCGDDSDSPPAKTPTPQRTATPTAVANQPPVLPDLQDAIVPLGTDWLFTVTASDPEDDPVTLSVEGLPGNAYFLSESGVFCLYADEPDQVGETIELTVRATNRDCYASGALAAAKFLVGKQPGLYGMNDVLGL